MTTTRLKKERKKFEFFSFFFSFWKFKILYSSFDRLSHQHVAARTDIEMHRTESKSVRDPDISAMLRE